jgi:hypothetical protein
MIWTDEADDLLIRLWDEGGSLAYVANGLLEAGYRVTRSAVSGRRHRLPPAAFRRATTTAIKPIKERKPRPTRSKPPVTKPITKPPETDVVKVATRTPVSAAEVNALARHVGVDYLEQTTSGCKAIMPSRSGDWQLSRVCGMPRGPDYEGRQSSYCPTHFRMFTNPLPKKAAHG